MTFETGYHLRNDLTYCAYKFSYRQREKFIAKSKAIKHIAFNYNGKLYMPYLEPHSAHLAHAKIWKAEPLAEILVGKTSENRKTDGVAQKAHIVFTNGCYDILHPGHVSLLAEAKSLGEILVLALNTDASVRRLGKGADRPINSLGVRAFMAAHLESVNYVTAFDEDTPREIIELLKPDVLVKGGDWPTESIVGADFVQANGGLVYSLPLLGTHSTTAFLQKVRG